MSENNRRRRRSTSHGGGVIHNLVRKVAEELGDGNHPPQEMTDKQQVNWRLERIEEKLLEMNGSMLSIRGDVALLQKETGEEVRNLREGQIGLTHASDQILRELKKISDKDSDAEKFKRSETGAWRRQILQSLIAFAALAVALAATLGNQC